MIYKLDDHGVIPRMITGRVGLHSVPCYHYLWVSVGNLGSYRPERPRSKTSVPRPNLSYFSVVPLPFFPNAPLWSEYRLTPFFFLPRRAVAKTPHSIPQQTGCRESIALDQVQHQRHLHRSQMRPGTPRRKGRFGNQGRRRCSWASRSTRSLRPPWRPWSVRRQREPRRERSGGRERRRRRTRRGGRPRAARDAWPSRRAGVERRQRDRWPSR